MLIYLVGFMGAGKTVAGKKLASALDYTFADLDKLIEKTYRVSIPGVFARYDEAAFRLMERSCLHSTFLMKNTVIATGGGAPCFFDNMEQINAHGISVYIMMPAGALTERLKKAKKKRPLLPPEAHEIEALVRDKLEARRVFYEKAHLSVPGIDLDVQDVVEQLSRFSGTVTGGDKSSSEIDNAE
jgi:shikimate kinase